MSPGEERRCSELALLEYLREMPVLRPRQRRGAAAASQRVSKKYSCPSNCCINLCSTVHWFCSSLGLPCMPLEAVFLAAVTSQLSFKACTKFPCPESAIHACCMFCFGHGVLKSQTVSGFKGAIGLVIQSDEQKGSGLS